MAFFLSTLEQREREERHEQSPAPSSLGVFGSVHTGGNKAINPTLGCGKCPESIGCSLVRE